MFDHPQSGEVYNFGRFCLSVCLLVCLPVCLSNDNFRKPWHRKFIFAHPVYLQGVRFVPIWEGHRVKVKVTGAKKVDNNPVFPQRKPACQHKSGFPQCENSIANNFASITQRAVTAVKCVRAAYDFRLRPIEWCDQHLCYVTGSSLTTGN